jgi:FMN phosphatase YigB (HAD superfamily)
MERKLVFLDVDGTLVGRDGKVPFSAREACRKAKEAGIKSLLIKTPLFRLWPLFYRPWLLSHRLWLFISRP